MVKRRVVVKLEAEIVRLKEELWKRGFADARTFMVMRAELEGLREQNGQLAARVSLLQTDLARLEKARVAWAREAERLRMTLEPYFGKYGRSHIPLDLLRTERLREIDAVIREALEEDPESPMPLDGHWLYGD